ncbi:zinc ABC transporter substrate-binding protein ZnuA [Pseudomonas asuensis]|uniref:High-affinity zinc uptake system protein ZnuA n=1 Tax=Pseudomonas asuensis TaxID=1825787 RepID=A0ABQ2GS66_9PSED|nr:zinc ABC transporter substrate-binding protein [Pseudomonas asuensis]
MIRSLIAGVLFGLTAFTASAQADVNVLTSIKPLQLIAAAVQEGVGSPDVLLPPGASPHNYALRPSDIRRIRDAQLFYWIGPDMEVFLKDVLPGRDKPSVAIQELPDLHLRRFVNFSAEAGHEHDHGHDHDEAFEHDHAHRPGSIDAHLWLSLNNARVIAARMAADLSAQDSANAEHYKANLAAFNQRLDRLDGQLKQDLTPLAGKPYFVFHEAFDYLEEAYGLSHRGVFAISGDVQPGARHVAAMRTMLKNAGSTCVFTEPPLRPRLADTLSQGLPVTLSELDPLGADAPVNASGYEALLTNLTGKLTECLGKI